jgi:GH24 family phage-related lysozyme (muramidase)
MVSLAYNIGSGAFGKSTLLKKHVAGDYAGAAKEFAKWRIGGGKVLAGLIKRRAVEAGLYSK